MTSNALSVVLRKVVRSRWVRSSGRYYECRRCGTEVDGEAAPCPYCGETEVVRYDLG